MAYTVILAALLVFTLAIDSQKENKSDTIYSEVSALKKYVFNLKTEIEHLRRQYDDMRRETKEWRSESHIYQAEQSKEKDKELPHKRSVYTPSFHLPWNISKVNTGPKGEKGDTGVNGQKGAMGPKGVVGSPGLKGNSGSRGPSGPKGNRGISGTNGQKGDSGSTGIKGLKGDSGSPGIKGLKGHSGEFGHTGPKGDVGPTGLTGYKGQKGNLTKIVVSKMVAFSATLIHPLKAIRNMRPIIFDLRKLNVGNGYDTSTGMFQCNVPGIYIFMWSIQINSGHALTTGLFVNGSQKHFLLVGGRYDGSSTSSASTVVHLDINDRVYIAAFTPEISGAVIGAYSCFSGYLIDGT